MLEDLKEKAGEMLNKPEVKQAVEKAKEFIQSEKGKEALASAKDKVEDFIEEKTGGKGIFGLGKKE